MTHGSAGRDDGEAGQRSAKGGWRRYAAVMLTALLVLASCGGDDDDASTPASDTAPDDSGNEGDGGGEDDVCTEDRVGGELTMGTLIPTRSLDPTVAGSLGSSGATEHAALYDTLVRYDTETGEFVPHVAESLEPNDDFSEWTLTAREGVQFGNGDPLTAEAIRFSIERFRTATVTGARMVAAIGEIEVVDDLTLVFRLNEPWANFPFVLASEVGGPVNPAVVEAAGAEFGNNPTGAGVGPFEFERFAPGEEVVMRAKDNYWGGPVCIETLRFVHVETGAATYEAFQAGELQAAFLRDAQVISDAEADGVEGLSDVIGAGWTLNFNNGVQGTNPATANPKVRQAIAHALDLDLVDERIYGGAGLPSGALIPEVWDISPGVEGPAYDPDQAQVLVDEAKAEGWDGNVSLLCGPLYGDLPVLVEGMLEAAGMTVDVEALDTNALIERYLSGNYETACFAINVYAPAPEWALDGFHSEAPNSYLGYANPDMDAALDRLALAGSPEDSVEVLAEIQEIWNETIPSIVLNATEEFVALDDSVHGVVLSQTTLPMFYDAYIEG